MCLLDTTNHYSALNRNSFVLMELHTKLTELLLTRCPLCLDHLYAYAFSLQNVFKVKVSHSCLFENSIVYMHFHTCLSLMLVVVGLFGKCSMYSLVCICVHAASYCFCFLYVCVIYLFHTHDLCSCSICLLFLMQA